jgi:3-hydroxy-3-methylglutaryl CoA synthase
VIVLVLVIGEDAVDPLPDHAQEGLASEGGVAAVVEGVGELLGEPDVAVTASAHQSDCSDRTSVR